MTFSFNNRFLCLFLRVQASIALPACFSLRCRSEMCDSVMPSPPNKSEVYDILPGRQAEGLVWVKLPGDEVEASLEAANE